MSTPNNPAEKISTDVVELRLSDEGVNQLRDERRALRRLIHESITASTASDFTTLPDPAYEASLLLGEEGQGL